MFFSNWFSRLFSSFSNDIAIDLGTANTLVYTKAGGVLINEPSVVAISSNTKKIIATGSKAKLMLGKNPDEVTVIKPLKDGVIADFRITELMLGDLIERAHAKKLLLNPRVIVCVPSGITEVEKRAVRDSALQAGARQVFLVAEPIAAAIGAKLEIHEATGNLILDIGGGTSEIAVISLSHIVVHNSIRIGGDKMDQDIVNFLKQKNNIFVGLQTAENIKKTIGSAFPLEEELRMKVSGRDAISDYPVTVEITSEEIREAISETVTLIIDAVKRLFEKTLPELACDIAQKGIVLTGGGALLKGFDKKLSETVDLPVFTVPNSLNCVVDGSGMIMNNLEKYKEVLIKSIEGDS